ncbi:hypothetical protein FBU30_005567 [Linnemannia zychae]|nr:hypothetical protein FBU30_005567 [Linnemannia zychae]
MAHSPALTSSSHSATATLEAFSSDSYHDPSPRLYTQNNSSLTSSSSSLHPSFPPARTYQPQNPQGNLESDNIQSTGSNGATSAQGPVSDAWAEHGHFPLTFESASRNTLPLRGGSVVLLRGSNFREGVKVAITCLSMKDSKTEPKVVVPHILKSTEMEFIAPNLLDWLLLSSSAANTITGTLRLLVKLTCASDKNDSSDPAVVFEMAAIEDSETELLHSIVGLHRQFIRALLTVDPGIEPEHTTRQRALALLSLDQPPTVTRAEHLALGVIYMLCEGRDLISDEGLDIIRRVTQEGHDMLHLAVVLGQKTLVRELARHLLGTFQSCAISQESEVFTRDLNGLTALDFATILEYKEIEKILMTTLQAAQDHKRSILGRATRPLPSIPSPQTIPSSLPALPPSKPSRSLNFNGDPNLSNSSSSALSSESTDRPLPPTPLTSPYKRASPEVSGNHSYFPSMAGIEATLIQSPPPIEVAVSTAIVSTSAADHHLPQRTNTVQATIEDNGIHTSQYHNEPSSTTMEHSTEMSHNQNETHGAYHQYPIHQHQNHHYQHDHHQHLKWPQQQQHSQVQSYPQHYTQHSQQQYYEKPLHTKIQHTPTLPNMPHLQAHGHHLNPIRPDLSTPPRANSVPLPRSNDPQTSNLQPQSSPILESYAPPMIAASVAGTYRPHPTTSFKASASLPPPKHIVTRVNRPKIFVVPTSSETTVPPLPTSMPVPEHKPTMIPPLLPDPPIAINSGHYQQYHHEHNQYQPIPLPSMPVPMTQHIMPHRQDPYGAPAPDDQIKVPVI